MKKMPLWLLLTVLWLLPMSALAEEYVSEDGTRHVTYEQDGYKVSQRYAPDGALDHAWWYAPDGRLYHEIWYQGGVMHHHSYWIYGLDGVEQAYIAFNADGSMRQMALLCLDAQGMAVTAETPEQAGLTGEDLPFINWDSNEAAFFFDEAFQCYGYRVTTAHPTEAGCQLVTELLHDGAVRREIWVKDGQVIRRLLYEWDVLLEDSGAVR